MKRTQIFTILGLVLGLMVCRAKVSEAVPMGTTFTYQGRLIDANSAADGLYDFQFKLFDDANTITGNQVGSDVNKPLVDVIDGYFTVELNFGSDVFSGDSRWLEIGVRLGDSNDPNTFITLGPLQELTPVPYALHTRGVFVGPNDTFLGNQAGSSNTTGYHNTFLGSSAGSSNTTGYSNTFLGKYSGYYNTTGKYNTFIGNNSGSKNTTGSDNTFLGYNSGSLNTTGYSNTFVGDRAGNLNTNGIRNTFIGSFAGYSNTTGYENTFVGRYAGRSNTTGYSNIFLGNSTGYSNTTGNYNTFIGPTAGLNNTTGYKNTFVGNGAGNANTTGYHNTFLGEYSGYYTITGNHNTFVGNRGGYRNTTGSHNTFVGDSASYRNTTGYSNTSLGFKAGYWNHTGSGNVFLGYMAGYNEIGSTKLYIANGPDDANVLIYGEFDTGKIGIGTTSPAATVDVNGTLALENGPPINEVSTDGTLVDNSDLAIPTEKAVKTYVDSQIPSSGVGIVPVGAVVSWLKSFPNTPSLSDNFVECNGQTLSDAESPFNGQIIPNLNGENRFLRGSSTSGTTGGSESHEHAVTDNYFSFGYGDGKPGVTSQATSITSTLPSYYEVVWIMRVK